MGTTNERGADRQPSAFFLFFSRMNNVLDRKERNPILATPMRFFACTRTSSSTDALSALSSSRACARGDLTIR
jgi:hypothetical protein